MANTLTVESYQELKIRGFTEKDIAREFGISYQTLHKWKKTNLKAGPVKKEVLLEEAKKTSELLRSSNFNRDSDHSLKEQLNKAKKDIAALEKELQKEKEEQQRHRSLCADLDKRWNTLRIDHENLKSENEDIEKQLNELKAENDRYKWEAKQLKKAPKTDSLAASDIYKRAALQLIKEKVDSGDVMAELLYELLLKEEVNCEKDDQRSHDDA
ncbi:helix-turn-helix domain-containing protein [Bacillus cabrialesii]|uniref:helix-turn-helix domain-containing protein n=1 Tax=Bacillus cabrialesii TaxID=2487276 RepID=UPI0028FB78E0|nr:hypothetical protein [Bacillus cabrialesii]MDU0154027.1 hypothetical protein [Bacillus cabrialesii]